MPQKTAPKRKLRRPQKQERQPGKQSKMSPLPKTSPPPPRPGGKLAGRVALVTGGDSGIGRAIVQLFAREGARVAFSYLREHADARETVRLAEAEGGECFAMAGDVGDDKLCKKLVRETIKRFKRLDVLVNNAAEQHPKDSVSDITPRQLERTFRTNIFSQFFMTQAAAPKMKAGAAIINTTSVTAYRGSAHLIDYSATKGAIVSFTRALSASLASRGIRVNAVAPGPVWTPLIPASFPSDKVATFGSTVPLGRAGEPVEIAPSYLFLACEDSAYITGQVLHPNGGEIING